MALLQDAARFTSKAKAPPAAAVVKMLLVGPSDCGKTCLLTRYAEGTYADSHIPTIGIDFKIKTVELGGNKVTPHPPWLP